MSTLIKTSKLYNGKEHTFTTLGAATNVVLKSGNGEQFQIQGTLNIVDGPDNPADILINGNNIGGGVSLADLSDVTLTGPIANGELLSYNSATSKWINVDSISVPNMYTTNLNVANNFQNNYSVLEVTSIQKLKCDNIRTGLTNCLLLANNAERIIPGYTDLNLNLTDGFLSLNTTITAVTFGTDCAYRGSVIKSQYGGTGNANSHGFVNTTTDDIHCDQDLSQYSEVNFTSVNGLEYVGDNYLGDNYVSVGQSAGIVGSMTNATLIGNQSGYLTSGLNEVTIVGGSAGYQASGTKITLLGYNALTSATSSTNLIMIGNSTNCDIPSTNLNNYFVIRGNGSSASVDPVIETYNMNNKTLMVTTLYGKTSINSGNFKYNDYAITFTTQFKFDQPLTTTSSPIFNDLGLYDLSLTYPMYLNCNETLSASRTINLKCIDANRDLTFRDNLTVGTNYISYGTQYLNFTGQSIMFGTDTNFSSGRIVYASPTTLTMGSSYIGVGTQYINFSGNSIAFGTDTTNFGSGKLTFNNPCNLTVSSAYLQLNTYGGISAYGKLLYTSNSTLQVDANSQINQNVTTSASPSFASVTLNNTGAKALTATSNGDCAKIISTANGVALEVNQNSANDGLIRLSGVGATNFWDLRHFTSNNSLNIRYNDTTFISSDVSGNITYPYNVNFQSYLGSSANSATGDGTTWVMQSLTSVYQRGSSFNNTNGVFTVPVTGIYQFSGTWTINNVQAGNECKVQIVAGGNVYDCSYSNIANLKAGGSNTYITQFNQIVSLSATNTAYAQITVYNTSKVVNVIAGLGATNFSGRLIA